MVSLDGKTLANYSITRQRTRIGRLPLLNDIVLGGSGISGAHAMLIQSGGIVAIEDLGSKNGTYVNGDRIRRTDLEDGGVVRIGPYSLTLRADRKAMAYEPTLLVRSAPETTAARLRRIDGTNAGEMVGLSKVVTSFGQPGACVVTFIRRGDQFAVRFTEGAIEARLNGDVLTDRPVVLNVGDILDIEGVQLQFEVPDA